MYVKRRLHYIYETMHLGTFLHPCSPIRLHAFSNADWATNANDQTSTSAHIVSIGANPSALLSR